MKLSKAEVLDRHSLGMTSSASLNGHMCFFHGTGAEHRSFISEYLAQALKCGKKVLYIADGSIHERIIDYMLSTGADARSCLARGQLRILSPAETYLKGGSFDPERMIDRLRGEIEQARSEGYPGLCFTSEMTWALGCFPGSQRLIEFEDRLNEISEDPACSILCQYDRRRFPPSVLVYAFLSHPYVKFDSTLYKNSYCGVSPSVVEEESASAALTHFLEKLAGAGHYAQSGFSGT
jgi:hypothetical protein